MRRMQKGFTAVELIVVVTVVGLIFAILLPYYLDSLERAKQRKTMANINSIGRSMMSWLTDQAGAAAAGAGTGADELEIEDFESITKEDLEAIMVPVYMATVPRNDGWGSAFDYYLKVIEFNDSNTIAIRSPGGDGVFSGTTYTMSPFVSTDYNQDIVWADGIFFRWPQNYADN